jgi:hypothetical protein
VPRSAAAPIDAESAWVQSLSSSARHNRALLARLADTLETCAQAVSLLWLVRSAPTPGVVPTFVAHRHGVHAAMAFAAEAQSMMRVVFESLGSERDQDQETIFFWLRRVTHDERYLVDRYMRMDDRADPAGVAELRNRIEAAIGAETAARASRKRVKNLWGKLEYHAGRIRRATDGAPDDWKALIAAVGALVADGTHPSDLNLRRHLLDIYEDVPEELVPGEAFEYVQRSIDEYLATRPVEEPAPRPTRPSAEVEQARRLLEGRTVVLIGGDRRPAREDALREAFGLRAVHWCEVSEQTPRRSDWESLVARPDVDLVILMIRWVRHANNEVVAFCHDLGKPCVRLPGGYHPNQVATQVLQQVSRKL